jgi:hypothetical protein
MKNRVCVCLYVWCGEPPGILLVLMLNIDVNLSIFFFYFHIDQYCVQTCVSVVILV